MNIREKQSNGTYRLGSSGWFARDEVVVFFDDGEAEQRSMDGLEVLIPFVGWVDMTSARQNGDIIPNNRDTSFDIPHSENERLQGFNWH